MTHEEYKTKFCNWKSRVKEVWMSWFECVAMVKNYCKEVRWYQVGRFWGTAYKGWANRKSTFRFKKSIVWFATVPVWSVVIFRPYAQLETKKPWTDERKLTKLWPEWHVAIVDYIDDDWVIRVIEQNWNWTSTWIGWDAIRVRGYRGKKSVCGFILEK